MPDDVLTPIHRQRVAWIRMHKQVQDVGLVCHRCGVTRPTLRKWLRACNKTQTGTNRCSLSP